MRSSGVAEKARHDCLRGRAALGVAVLALVLGSAAYGGPNGFRNVWNAPFASISDGPQGAIVVDGPASTVLDTAARKQAVRDAIAQQHSPRALSQAAAAVRFLRTRGIEPRAELRVPRMIVHTRAGRPILPDLYRARTSGVTIGDPANNITFQYEGWSTSDEQALQAYLDDAMPIARAIYGPPAFDTTVKIIQDDTLQTLQGGTYDVTTNELRLPKLSGNFPEDSFVLIMLVLNAFRDDVALFYDSWEQGMIGAAATAVQISPGASPGYDPANPGPFYSGSVYEPMNQPPLGNSTWYPPGFSGMLVWRIAEARVAWFKCYTEDPQFFLRFNTRYYAKLNSLSAGEQTALAGDTPSLLEVCQTVLPNVEGSPFVSWYRQQYALDTSVTVGPKMYCWNIPLTDAVALIVEHYETTPTGDEIPKGGTAYTTYFNYDFTLTLFAQEGNEITIPATGDSAGEGFLLPTFFNVGGPQRITVQIEINGLWARYPFPYGVRGFDPGENNLYGCIIGPIEGTINVVGLDGLTDVEVKRGVWGGIVSDTGLSPTQLEITFDDGKGNQVTRKVNVAFDSYDVLFPAGARSALAKNLPVGTNGLYMISVPLWCIEQDPARALGIPNDKLLLARWKPNAPGGGTYDIYPTIDPLAPGLGYWLRVLSDVTIAVDGILPPDSDDVPVKMNAGWNMIGCARNRNVDLGELLVQRGAADSEPFADAITDGWVQGGLWAYSQQSGYELTQKLKPFEGYWLRCLLPEGATLLFPTSTAAASTKERTASADSSPFGKTLWQTALTLDVGSSRSTATMGAARSAGDGFDARCDLQAPPPFGDQPTLHFANDDWGPNAGEYASDFRGPRARGPWKLRVANLPRGVRARLRWPDLSQVPQEFRPVLLDRARGRTVYMRTSGGYEFTGTGTPCGLEIVLRRDKGANLAVTGLIGAQSGQSMAITYALSADAAVSVRILNIAGRPVRDLVLDKPQTTGCSTLVWNLRGATGAPVPNGAYLIELTARSEDGQVAHGIGRTWVNR